MKIIGAGYKRSDTNALPHAIERTTAGGSKQRKHIQARRAGRSISLLDTEFSAHSPNKRFSSHGRRAKAGEMEQSSNTPERRVARDRTRRFRQLDAEFNEPPLRRNARPRFGNGARGRQSGRRGQHETPRDQLHRACLPAQTASNTRRKLPPTKAMTFSSP